MTDKKRGPARPARKKKKGRIRLRAVDIFCGGGGSSHGASLAGAKLVGAVDRWSVAVDTYRDNFPDAHLITKPLEDIADSTIRRRFGNINLLLASPECTNHTPAKGAAARSEKSRSTAFQVTRLAKLLKPRWIVVENVVQMKKWRRYKGWLKEVQDLGYKSREQTLNSARFGVPQSRRRLFITFDRDREPPAIKPSTRIQTRSIGPHLAGPQKYAFTPLRKEGRAEATIKRAERAIAALRKRGKHHRPFLMVYYGTDGSGGWQTTDRPLRTITTVDRFALVKFEKNRYWMRMLQVDELRLAMGFKPFYKFEQGNRRDKIAVLGNGVCPPVMKKIVETLTAR